MAKGSAGTADAKPLLVELEIRIKTYDIGRQRPTRIPPELREKFEREHPTSP